MSDTEPIVIPRKVRIVGTESGHMFPRNSVVFLTGGPDTDGDFVGTGTNAGTGKVDWWYLKPGEFVEVLGSTPLGVPEPEAGPAEAEAPEPANEPDELGAAARLLDGAPRYPQDYPDMTKALIPEGYSVGTEAPEPALKAALLEDAKTTEPDQPRQVLRDVIEMTVHNAYLRGQTGTDTDAILAAVDRYVDSLPQAQVEYATEQASGVNPEWKAAQQAEQDAWVRRTALEQAVELVKAGVSPDLVETAAEAANKFHTFLTGSTD